MRKLGISIYPEKSSKEKIISYLEKTSELGFSRVFSCLLSVSGNKEQLITEFKEINGYAQALGFEVIVYVSPNIFKKLNISYDDLSFFSEINADGLRLDRGFSGAEEAMMTYNPYDLKIEINMSNDVHTIDTIMDHYPNRFNLLGCHNFYPHRYSGLGKEHFKSCSHNFKKYGLRTAAFISSQTKDSFGPWPVTDGLPTLEEHRELSLDTQLLHHIILNEVDDIIISNCYPSEEEIRSLSRLDLMIPTFSVTLNPDIPKEEKDVVLNMLHYNRGDVSEYLIRSSEGRIRHKGHTFKLFNTPDDINVGDIIIESSDYGHYAGELQIARRSMKNSGKSNVVGRIREDQIPLLKDIKPWQKFKFYES